MQSAIHRCLSKLQCWRRHHFQIPSIACHLARCCHFHNNCQERSDIHFSDLLNMHMKTMHGLAPNRPILPWLIYVFRDVAVPPHKCRHKDLHQPSFTDLLAALYDRINSPALPKVRVHAPEALTLYCCCYLTRPSHYVPSQSYIRCCQNLRAGYNGCHKGNLYITFISACARR